jgi:hypothetical protein
MPQLVVDMNIKTLININRKLKVNNIEMRHAPYLNRYRQLEQTASIKIE